jgi:hypothetical protein
MHIVVDANIVMVIQLIISNAHVVPKLYLKI